MKYQDKGDWWIEKIFMLWFLISVNSHSIISYFVDKAGSKVGSMNNFSRGGYGEMQLIIAGMIGFGAIGLIIYKKLGFKMEVIVIVLSFIIIYFVMFMPNTYIEWAITDTSIKAQCYVILRSVILLNQLLLLMIWICKLVFKRDVDIVISINKVFLPAGLLVLLVSWIRYC